MLFCIDKVFFPRILKVLIFPSIFAIIGLIILVYSFMPLLLKESSTQTLAFFGFNNMSGAHYATPLDHFLLFFVGIFFIVPLFGAKSTIKWYIKATMVKRNIQPVEMFLTTWVEKIPRDTVGDKDKIYCGKLSPSLTDHDSAQERTFNIDCNRIAYLSYKIYDDVPAPVQMDPDDDKSPIVMNVDEHYLVSERVN